MNKLYAIVVLCVFMFSNGAAQDLHFSNYAASPHNLSPAKVGDFYGTYKIGAIIRDQFSSFFNQGFRTQGLFAEANVPYAFKPHHWTSVGVFFDNDKSGDLGLGRNMVGVNVAYHLALDYDYRNVLSVGLQYSYVSLQLDPTKAKNLFLDDNVLDFYNNSYSDFNLGFSFKSRLNKSSIFEIGTGLYHLIASTKDVATRGSDDLFPLRVNAYTALSVRTSKKISITPRIQYSKAEEASNLAAQFIGTYWLEKSEIDFGVGYRFGDAIQFLMGYHIKNWTITGAFDMTVSSAAPYNDRTGAFELGAYTILAKYPKAKVELIEICPRL